MDGGSAAITLSTRSFICNQVGEQSVGVYGFGLRGVRGVRGVDVPAQASAALWSDPDHACDL